MKHSPPLFLALLCAALLSSCVFDPYASVYYDSGYSHYHGGYHNGFYSDYYVGIHNNYYRYRHTRCSHCNHYPCHGGHRTDYHTYYRNYQKPLHNHNRGQSHHRDSRAADNDRGRSRKLTDSYDNGIRPSSRSHNSSSSRPTPRGNPPKSYSLGSGRSRSSASPSRSRPSPSRPERSRPATPRPSPPPSPSSSSKTDDTPSKSSAPSKSAPSKSRR